MLQENSIRRKKQLLFHRHTTSPHYLSRHAKRASCQKSLTEVGPKPFGNAHVMQCIHSEHHQKRCGGPGAALSSRLPFRCSTREKVTPIAMENVGGTLKCWFERLASKMRRKDMFFLAKKSERATLDETHLFLGAICATQTRPK